MAREKDYMAPESASLPLIAGIIGATGTGKTVLALGIARRFRGSIISADSMQVYEGMDVGTAKLSLSERLSVPHALIDVIPPNERFSVAQYQLLALEAVNAAIRLQRLPILVGGTGLYVRAVEDSPYVQTSPSHQDRQTLQANRRIHSFECQELILRDGEALIGRNDVDESMGNA